MSVFLDEEEKMRGVIMIGAMILFALVVVMIYGLSLLYKRGGKYLKMVKVITVMVLIVLLYFNFAGPSFRLSSLSAARANGFVEKEDEWLGKIELNDHEVHVFYDSNDNWYRSVFVEKVLFGHRSNLSTQYYPHKEDELRTIGGMHVSVDEGVYYSFMVTNSFTDISRIALYDSSGNMLTSTKIGVNDMTTLSYRFNGNENRFAVELVALDDEGVPRYYYGYEHGNNDLKDDEYKWYSF